jgi:hypothetical protein
MKCLLLKLFNWINKKPELSVMTWKEFDRKYNQQSRKLRNDVEKNN